MRVSELVERSGVPLATIKFYLREGVLMPGEATSATQSRYGEQHVQRLALIKALAGAGLPIHKIRAIVRLVDEPGDDLYATLGRAVAMLPPYPDGERDADGDYPRARRVLERLGQVYDPDFPAVAQLERALKAVEEVGIPMTDQRVDAYGRHIMGIARMELDLMPADSAAAVEYAVLGTAVYEPVIAAMRRVAYQDIASRIFLRDMPETRKDI
ncbi:MerR family transcriptional regulator [Rhodococcus spelaei]|uniref:MerR family transcriptional regulator n=1 Tax=Rhodococcus spelaei TaxID=2546320 RepID=A0A541B8F1_9NOCA|nr:MerR family transcriptional regulator [Rhodococcus spelaei]TQF68594.1 MerR family transcriptional regulator [Rhodococcus spelaei]